MAELNAERVFFDTLEEVVPQGAHVFLEPPVLKVSMQDGLADGDAWSVLIDTVMYHRALFEAEGRNAKRVEADSKAVYIAGLETLDIDGFEAEMFWETYLDVEWEREHPFALDDETPEGLATRSGRALGGGRVTWQDDGIDGPVEEIDPDSET